MALELDDGMLSTFDWGSGRTIAAGSTAGEVLSFLSTPGDVETVADTLPPSHRCSCYL